nr:hypothetical protein [Streptomyces coryli]
MTTGGSASAYPDPGFDWDHIFGINSDTPASGVRVYAEENGDYISVCDTAKDGYSAKVIVGEDGYSGDSYGMTASGGKGTCKTHKASDGARYNLEENNGVSLKYWAKGGDNYAYFKNDH